LNAPAGVSTSRNDLLKCVIYLEMAGEDTSHGGGKNQDAKNQRKKAKEN